MRGKSPPLDCKLNGWIASGPALDPMRSSASKRNLTGRRQRKILGSFLNPSSDLAAFLLLPLLLPPSDWTLPARPRSGPRTTACGRSPSRRRACRCERRRSRAGLAPALREALGAQAVVVGERRREARRRDAGLRGGDDDAAPRLLRARDRFGEIRRREQRLELGLLGVGVGDAVEELGADDTAAAPDPRHGAEIDVPAVLLGAGADGVEALRIGDDLRGVEGEADVFDEGLAIADLPRLGGPGSLAAASRCLGCDERARAKTASAMPETGTPRSSEVCTVHTPVPFDPAWSRTMSMNGLPVLASTCFSTSAVISMRYDSSSLLFHFVKTSAISAGSRPAAERSRS